MKFKKSLMLALLLCLTIITATTLFAACNNGNPKNPTPEHTHSYADWLSNETAHWKKCECGEVDNIAAHSFDGNNLCICGYKKTDITDEDNEKNPDGDKEKNPVIAQLNFELNDDNETYSVVGVANLLATQAIIPCYYNGKLVTSIGDEAFRGCSELKHITIPNTITSIGFRAFDDCDSLRYYVDDNRGHYLGNAENNYLVFIRPFNKKVTSTVINPNTKIIAPSAFAACMELTSVTIPEGVTNISWGAFSNCQKLKSVSLPDSLNIIDDWAFCYCSKLSEITIPDRVTYMGSRAFYGCYNIRNISLGSSLSYIGELAFDCSSIEHIAVSDQNNNFYCKNDCLVQNETNILVLGCQNSVIPDDVTCIGYGAFYRCIKLTGITLPNNITSIYGLAFADCSELTEIIIPENVSQIMQSAFERCTKLQIIVLPDKLTLLSRRIFRDCSSLKSVIMGSSILYVDEEVFEGCIDLEAVYYKGTAKKWNNLRSFDAKNEVLLSKLHFYSEEQPIEYGNYWHYENGEPVIWGKEN